MYYWRRRLPNALASWFHKCHLFLSLQTPDPNFARRLVVLLDAKLEEVVTAFENAEMHLTPPQVDGLLRNVVTTHLNKLERLSAAAKSFPEFDAAQAKRDTACIVVLSSAACARRIRCRPSVRRRANVG
jgi:hypothetical protein